MPRSEAQKLCLQCRKCCAEVQIDTAYENDDRDAKEFYRRRGFKVMHGPDGYLTFELALPCPELTDRGCRVYRRRPKVCREYSGEDDYGKGCWLNGLKKRRLGGK